MNILHALTFYFTSLLTVLIFGAAYGQTDATTASNREIPVASTTATVPSTISNTTEPRNCSTTWRFPGRCVLRLMCDNNTPAIDLTPYAPRGPKRECPKGEVCCPPDLIVSPTPSPPPAPSEQKPNKFDFDDDD